MMNKILSMNIMVFLVFVVLIIAINKDIVSGEHDHKEFETQKALNDHEEISENHEHENSNDLSMSIDEILSATCEHEIKTIECDICRYEVGVVRVDPEIIVENNSEGLIKVEVVTEHALNAVIKTTGEVRVNENKTVHIRSRLSGLVQKVHVDFGEKVKKGDPLVTLDSIELGEAIADLLKTHASMKLAQTTYEREKSLYAKKVSSEREMLEAKSQFDQLKIELESQNKKLYLYGLESEYIDKVLQEGSSNSGKITIFAPQDGIVIYKHVVHGELITSESELFTVTEISSLWVWADIYDRDLASLIAARQEGNVIANVKVVAFPQRIFKGELDYIGVIADETTRTVKVRININNEDFLLRPGMFCQIDFSMNTGRKMLALPVEAILTDACDIFIFKRLKDNYFVRRSVSIGQKFGSFTEIVSGIDPGDEIVFFGAFILKSDVLRSKMGAGCAD
ncbi:MAG: hypothetical protein A2161_22120 [Candidatus Schekmanbacteria bacterium RBG_13_48_7]|uniref:Uncharacterized protein n=1 Tax=Candidatus Schekmanbacteria bacterium RBG_13_48_7 TaxID=1817878 RepID=A0A1F7RY85_9BACT|nr:MAG: hypothetical protein A2161_22120 [Candidatus Schekmanbacteria bacterium RBG_13_48_7]